MLPLVDMCNHSFNPNCEVWHALVPLETAGCLQRPRAEAKATCGCGCGSCCRLGKLHFALCPLKLLLATHVPEFAQVLGLQSAAPSCLGYVQPAMAVSLTTCQATCSQLSSAALRHRGWRQPLCQGMPLRSHRMTRPALAQVKPRGDYVALVAKRDIMAGEQLEISYGALSNDFLLLDYGFTVAGNPHDRVSLRFGFELLQVSGSARLSASGNSLSPEALMFSAAIVLMSPHAPAGH